MPPQGGCVPLKAWGATVMGVTDPSETYFKQGLWAYDANAKAWVELEVDPSGYLKTTGSTLPSGAATSAHQVTQNTALALIAALYNALHSVHLDEIDVDVQASVLPTDAATAAHQVTAQTTLDALVDVRHALHTVAIDELDVDVQASVLPTDAATSAHQVTQNTALELIDDLYNALHSVHLDEIDVDVQASVLPTDAATSAHQVTQNTALALIDDLYNALHTVHTDELDVHIDGQTADLQVQQQTPADLTAALHGHISAAWQKLPLLWGYSDRMGQKVLEPDAAAGDNTIASTDVPAGEIHILQGVSAKDIDNAPTSIRLFLTDGTVQPTLLYQGTTAAGVDAHWSGEIVLKEGDGVRAKLTGCLLNDNITMHIWGYRLDIDL